MDQDDRTIAAQLLGMKPSEIIGVTEISEGLVITTHDGQRTLATRDGVLSPWTGREIQITVAAAPVRDERQGQSQGEPEPVPVPVPDGTIAEVLVWVDGDSERAVRAWEAEAAKDKPRASLVAELEKLAQG